MMMLVQPADAVQAPATGVASHFSLSSLLHKSGSTSMLSSALVPSWLALLAAVVLLSSARAALLYAHGRRSRKGKGPAGVVIQEKTTEKEEKEKKESVDKASPTPTRSPSPPSASASPAPSPKSVPPSPSPAVSVPAPAPARTSWFWGLVSWNRSSLPTLPLQVQRSTRQLEFQRLQRLAGDRGRTLSMGRRAQDIEQQQMAQRGLRSPPAFASTRFPSPPPPAHTTTTTITPSLPYHTAPTAPASMAKMIMSRHTFRRPAARPPPVRSARAVQYSRKYVPPPSPSPSESDEEEELEELEEGTSSKTGEEEEEKLCV